MHFSASFEFLIKWRFNLDFWECLVTARLSRPSIGLACGADGESFTFSLCDLIAESTNKPLNFGSLWRHYEHHLPSHSWRQLTRLSWHIVQPEILMTLKHQVGMNLICQVCLHSSPSLHPLTISISNHPLPFLTISTQCPEGQLMSSRESFCEAIWGLLPDWANEKESDPLWPHVSPYGMGLWINGGSQRRGAPSLAETKDPSRPHLSAPRATQCLPMGRDLPSENETSQWQVSAICQNAICCHHSTPMFFHASCNATQVMLTQRTQSEPEIYIQKIPLLCLLGRMAYRLPQSGRHP